MNVNQPAFRSEPAATAAITVTSASKATQIQNGRHSRHFRLYNAGSEPVFVEFGTVSTAAVIPTDGGSPVQGGIPVVPGVPQVFAAGVDYIAAICAVGPATLYVTPGEGMQ